MLDPRVPGLGARRQAAPTPIDVKISTYIEQDLESRIRAGAGLPEKLTLGGIASSYGVSATPVRRAIDALIAKNLVLKLDNGRLEARPPRGSRFRAKPIGPTGPDELAAKAILERKIAEELARVGLSGVEEFIREQPLAERLGVGRTRVREVLSRLAGSGLLQHVARRGWQVPTFRMADMDAYIDVRETLELKALDLARPRIEESEIDRMLDGNRPKVARTSRINNDLHGYFIACAQNRYIESFFESNGRFYRALFDYATLSSRAMASMAGQHVEILENVKARRWARARAALAHHIRAQKPVMEAMIAAHQSKP